MNIIKTTVIIFKLPSEYDEAMEFKKANPQMKVTFDTVNITFQYTEYYTSSGNENK